MKIPFYKQLGGIVKPQAIFGSNTSSLKIADFARPSGRPEKFVSGVWGLTCGWIDCAGGWLDRSIDRLTDRLAGWLAADDITRHDKQNQVGLHFFNPVQLMKLVEIVRIPETEQAVFEAMQGRCACWGRAVLVSARRFNHPTDRPTDHPNPNPPSPQAT